MCRDAEMTRDSCLGSKRFFTLFLRHAICHAALGFLATHCHVLTLEWKKRMERRNSQYVILVTKKGKKKRTSQRRKNEILVDQRKIELLGTLFIDFSQTIARTHIADDEIPRINVARFSGNLISSFFFFNRNF